MYMSVRAAAAEEVEATRLSSLSASDEQEKEKEL
jgi:hypothetical protein